MSSFFVLFVACIASVSAFVPHHPSALGSRIIGGTDAAPGAFPHQGSLRNWGFHFCGCFIISESSILTAAHCVIGSNPAFITAWFGTNTLDAGGDSYGIRGMVHHDYDFSFHFNDISILFTSTNIRFGNLVRPISLPTEAIKEGTTVTLSGWGSTWLGGSAPNNLQTLEQRTVSTEVCQERHSPLPVIDSQLCAFTVQGEGACHGDSGSALVLNGYAVGIVSWGMPCARGYPDVYTNVYSFDDWIQEQLQAEEQRMNQE